MWENVQIFVYQVSDSHKCLLQKVTPTIKSLFAIESNAAYKISLGFKSCIEFRKPKTTALTQCRSMTLPPGEQIPTMSLNSWQDPSCQAHVSIPIPASSAFQILELQILVGLGPKVSTSSSSLWGAESATRNPSGLAGNSPSQPSWVGKGNPAVVVVQDQLLVRTAQVRKGGGAAT